VPLHVAEGQVLATAITAGRIRTVALKLLVLDDMLRLCGGGGAYVCNMREN